MKCQLCNNQYGKLAKSHILPIGFFNNIPSKGRVDTLTLDGEKGRKLQKAIWDSELLCPSCERNIMSPLDDYAIKVFRDKFKSFIVETPSKDGEKIIVFEDINQSKLRAFLASILWRVSASKQKEVKMLSIGSTYEKRIATDLYPEIGDIKYVDAFTFFLTDSRHMAFFLPYKKKIYPMDTKRDHQNVNGWVLQFPNISIRVSLDKRPHPQRMYYNLDSELTTKPESILASTSLLAGQDGYAFMAFQIEKNETAINKMVDAMKQKEVINA